jgi:hypothetical protein
LGGASSHADAGQPTNAGPASPTKPENQPGRNGRELLVERSGLRVVPVGPLPQRVELGGHGHRGARLAHGFDVAQLLRTGDSLGRRLLASVTPQGTLVIEPEPAFVATTAYVWTRDGRLRDATGRYLLPGVLPAGQWVQIEALLTADWQADTTRFLVESAEYDVENGRWVLQPKEAANPFDLGTEQG